MTEADLKFTIEKIEQYGLGRPDHDQLWALVDGLHAEPRSVDACLLSIGSLM